MDEGAGDGKVCAGLGSGGLGEDVGAARRAGCGEGLMRRAGELVFAEQGVLAWAAARGLMG